MDKLHSYRIDILAKRDLSYAPNSEQKTEVLSTIVNANNISEAKRRKKPLINANKF